MVNITKLYWTVFIAMILFLVVSCVLLLVGGLIRKEHTRTKEGKIKTIIYYILCTAFAIWSIRGIVLCAQDVYYVKNQEFIVIEGRIESFTYRREGNDPDDPILKSPQVLNLQTGESVVLHLNNVELGEVYTIRYLPHTKIAEVIE